MTLLNIQLEDPYNNTRVSQQIKWYRNIPPLEKGISAALCRQKVLNNNEFVEIDQEWYNTKEKCDTCQRNAKSSNLFRELAT